MMMLWIPFVMNLTHKSVSDPTILYLPSIPRLLNLLLFVPSVSYFDLLCLHFHCHFLSRFFLWKKERDWVHSVSFTSHERKSSRNRLPLVVMTQQSSPVYGLTDKEKRTAPPFMGQDSDTYFLDTSFKKNYRTICNAFAMQFLSTCLRRSLWCGFKFSFIGWGFFLFLFDLSLISTWKDREKFLFKVCYTSFSVTQNTCLTWIWGHMRLGHQTNLSQIPLYTKWRWSLNLSPYQFCVWWLDLNGKSMHLPSIHSSSSFIC